MEFLFEILAEVLLQLVVEIIMELGLFSLRNTLRRTKDPVFSTIGFFLWGVLAGGISLWPFPHSFIASHELRLVNLIVTPLAAGGIMMLIGRYKEKRGHTLVGLDRFGYAFAFALAMSCFRFYFAK